MKGFFFFFKEEYMYGSGGALEMYVKSRPTSTCRCGSEKRFSAFFFPSLRGENFLIFRSKTWEKKDNYRFEFTF